MAKKKLNPDLARIDPATPESGLFKVRSKTATHLKAEEFEHTINTDDGPLLIKYATPYALNDTDMRIFLAAVGLCSEKPKKVGPKSESGSLQQNLWDKFLPMGEALKKSGSYTQTTSYALCKAAGLSWGKKTAERITESLTRMQSVTSTWRMGGRVTSGSRMISFAHDEDSGELAIAVSPLFAQAILGNAERYIRVSLKEMRTLKHPASAIVHLIMTSRMSLGPRRKKRDLTISIDKLSDSVYGKATSEQQRRDRRRNLQPAFEELDQMDGWHVFYNIETGKVNFARETPKSLENLQRSADRIERELNETDEE